MKTWWSDKTVSELQLEMPSTVSPDVTCKQAVEILQTNDYDQLPVVTEDGEVLGVVTSGNLSAQLTSCRVAPSDPITKVRKR